MTKSEVLQEAADMIPAKTKVRFHAFAVTDSNGEVDYPLAIQKSNKLEVCVNKAVNNWEPYGKLCVVIDSETGEQVGGSF